MSDEYCLVHGRVLHSDKRSGFDVCYDCERDSPKPGAEEKAREWLIHGGAGHEDGEDGLRAATWSSGAVIEALAEYASHVSAADKARIKSLEENDEFWKGEVWNFQRNAAHRARQLADELAKHDTVRAEAAEARIAELKDELEIWKKDERETFMAEARAEAAEAEVASLATIANFQTNRAVTLAGKLESAEAELASVRKYAQHLPDCNISLAKSVPMFSKPYVCTCGLLKEQEGK